ncbi:GNAT family N-acetyltransferase [Agrobacterium sp. a22-2]|uniref:GNAT family N-acetyltransferase n=1 Tax=Agrobacterium sp. a22-2 TaxID=2283840 RepID=UPI001FEF35BF|nr:GNAT family N-acetyltransferase [Agrobacterium sp. a22-2]
MPADRAGLNFRQDYFDDPAGWAAIKSLLYDIFSVDLDPLDSVGGYDRTSFPSAFFDESGRCIANLSGFAMPLIIDGRPVKAAGWQSGAVRPDYRGLGLFRALIRHTLQRGEEQGFEAVVLYTDKPGLYAPHGFRTVRQFSFRGDAPRPIGGQKPARRLTIESDLGLLQRLLAKRTPVSQRLAVTGQAEMFLLNCHLVEDVSLSLMPDEKTVVAWRMTDGGAFQLLDVVGEQVPCLAEILGALDLTPASVETFIPPDRLAFDGEPVGDDGPLVLMMRCADDLLPTEPCCLSPLAEF